MEEENKLTENVFVSTPEMEQWKNEANNSFEKAISLSPKRQIVLKEWAKTGIITGDYEIAEKRLQECIGLNPNYNLCYWIMALAKGYSGNSDRFNYFFNIAKEKGYDTKAEESLKQLVDMYIRVKNYNNLPELYLKLIGITEDKQKKAQLYATLAAVYQELGQIENSRDATLKIIELIPFFPADLQTQAKRDVGVFLRSLINIYIGKNDYNSLVEVFPKLIEVTDDKQQKAQIYASLAAVYKELGNIEKARESALEALKLMPEIKPDVDAFLKSLEQ
jgi:tetratricopeptide (TPR) repeat protein